jgi:two-component system, NarL family, response regulator YdfI
VTRIFLIVAPGPARERLEDLLDSSEVAIVGWAGDFEALDDNIADEAEVLLADATSAPLEDLWPSLQDARALRQMKVVLLTDLASPVSVNQAIRAGVRGILPAELAAEQLVIALEAVARGLVVLHPNGLETPRAADHSGNGIMEIVEPLTAREREVLQMLSEGLGNKEIATRLKISEHTVKFHVASILGKLGAASRTEAVSLALRRGLILL